MAVVPEGGKGSVRRGSDAPIQKLRLGRLKPGEVKQKKNNYSKRKNTDIRSTDKVLGPKAPEDVGPIPMRIRTTPESSDSPGAEVAVGPRRDWDFKGPREDRFAQGAGQKPGTGKPTPSGPDFRYPDASGREVAPYRSPAMAGRQWVNVERMDRPNPAARPMPTQRAAIAAVNALAVDPHPGDAAANRAPGQMTMFPDMPHSTHAQALARSEAERTGAIHTGDAHTGGWVRRAGEESSGQGYMFRPQTDREQQAGAQRAQRMQSMKAANGQ